MNQTPLRLPTFERRVDTTDNFMVHDADTMAHKAIRAVQRVPYTPMYVRVLAGFGLLMLALFALYGIASLGVVLFKQFVHVLMAG